MATDLFACRRSFGLCRVRAVAMTGSRVSGRRGRSRPPAPLPAPQREGRDRVRARLRSVALADRPDRRRRPRPVDVERQMRCVLRFFAGGVGLDRIDAQSPSLGDEIDDPFEPGAHAVAGPSRRARLRRGRCRG